MADDGRRFRAFRLFSFVTTIATYVLIFMGGLVRVSGAGLGCPDWPRCFGRWIPPTSVDQLPAGMDPAQFNFVLAWIEYTNRLMGVTVGLLIGITTIWALVKFRDVRGVVLPAVLAGLLTIFQGWQGSVVVSSLLEPVVVTVHTVLALIIVSLLILVTFEAYHREKPKTHQSAALPKNISRLSGVLWLIGIVQILLGTQIRSAIEVLREEKPLLTVSDWMSGVGAINHIHMTLGVAVAVLAWYVAVTVWKYKDNVSSLMRQLNIGLVVVVSLQVVVGMAFIVMEMTPLKQVFHLWLASIFIGISLLMYVISKKQSGGA